MFGPGSRKSGSARLIACLAVLCASPASAQSDNFERADALHAQADKAFNQAVDDANVGRNSAACKGFKSARSLYTQADFAVTTTSNHASVIRAAERFSKDVQNKADKASKYATTTCGKSDGLTQTGTTGSSSSTSSDGDLKQQQSAVLAKIRLAGSQYQDADRKNKAGDHAGACASARLSANNFAQVRSTLKANGALAATFTQVDQLYANADQVAADRDKVFCRGNLSSVSVQPKSSTRLTVQAVTGRFVGAYVCGQGKTALRLDLQAGASGGLAGTFTFGGSDGVPAGSFAMKGHWSPDGFALSGDHWINQPAGFSMTDLVGHLSSDGRLSGNVKAQGCSNFDVARQ